MILGIKTGDVRIKMLQSSHEKYSELWNNFKRIWAPNEIPKNNN